MGKSRTDCELKPRTLWSWREVQFLQTTAPGGYKKYPFKEK